MNKRILSVFLTICMVVGLFPSLVNAEDITIVIPPFIDQPETPVSEIIKRMEEDIPKVPDGVVTPYGTGRISPSWKKASFLSTPRTVLRGRISCRIPYGLLRLWGSTFPV